MTSELQIVIKKNQIFFNYNFFYLQFLTSKPCIRIRIHIDRKCWIRIMPALHPLALRHTPFYAAAAPRLKRSLPEERESLELRFSALGREFVLQLEPDHTIFHKVPYRTRVSHYQGCASGSVFGIQIRIQKGKNDPQSRKKLKNFMF